jgi:putative transposase
MKGFYRSLKDVELPSCYKVAIITRACAVLESRRKSTKRGIETRHPKPLKPVVCITSGFFVTMKGRLFIPLQKRNDYVDVLLNHHVREAIERKELRSLTVTPESLSFCYSEEVEAILVRTVYGVDRNEKNLTFGNRERVVQLDLSKTVRIRQMTREIVGSFKRNDVRVRKMLASKYWKRASHRTNQILHAAMNYLVNEATENGAALALEDLSSIRKMYQEGNKQGADYRFRLNSWPYWKACWMLEYKSAWKGVTFVPLTKAETYGSSSECASCGERLHEPERKDAEHKRMLWCQRCKVWTDRDVNAALNLSERGRSRFDRSLPRSAASPATTVLLAGGKGWQVKQ